MWDLIVSVPDHCLSFYFTRATLALSKSMFNKKIHKFKKAIGVLFQNKILL